MPLESTLFKGDPALEACLIHDAAHITQGAAGDHVGKIQKALRQIDNLAIAPGELSHQTYGLSTAAAVLDFKTRRSIINKAYQTDADNIVGKMTINALDTELVCRETGVVAKAYATIPEALAKVRNARARLLIVRAAYSLPNPIGNQKEQAIAEWNFKTNRARDPAAQVDKILLIYDRMVEAFFRASHFRKLFLCSKRLPPPESGAPAFTTLGGYFYGMAERDKRTGEFQNAIYVTPEFANKVFAATIIVHEMAHYCGGKEGSLETIEHRASPEPPPRGRRLENGGHNYAEMTADEAYRNAQSYQAYCDPETLGKPPD